jgi:fatty-acyl-CoA synthase
VKFVGLPDAIRQHAQESPGAPAIAMRDRRLDYQQLAQRIERATAWLDRRGIGAGERVAYLGLNHVEQIVLLAALMRVGAILVPLNYRLAARELAAIVEHAGAKIVVADDELAQLAGELGVSRESRQGLSAAFDIADDRAPLPIVADITAATPALLVYTSGTTGSPKGALHTHGGLCANAMASIAMHDLKAGDRILTALPLFHVGGLCIQTLPALYAGASVLLHPRFDPAEWLRALDEERPTLSLLVPATMRTVIEHPEWLSTDLQSLRIVGAGSSTIPDSLIEAFHARGVPVCQIYGATETGPVSIVLRADEAFSHVGAAGRPALDCSIRLVDANGDDVPDGSIGEIWVRAPNVMQGYWRDPANEAFRGGWFHTGDLARRDADGYFTVAGRAQDLIISGGENIYPAEIENVLAGVREIAEAAVIGLPDRKWGEVPVAVVVLRGNAALDEDAIRARLDAALARFKHPRRIVVRPALPRSAMGKVQKHVLIADLQAAAQAVD